jgi:Tfp pilus assembly protein PilN
MFTIDLLKGHGIPVKSSAAGVAIGLATFAVPVIVALAMLTCYLHNIINIPILKWKTLNCQTKIKSLSNAAELQKSFEKQKDNLRGCLSEVASSIGGYSQWSPVLATLVENIPPSVILTGLEAKHYFVKRKTPQKNDPEKTVEVSIPARILRIGISGTSDSNCDKEVRDFQDRLRSSAFLGPKLEDIRVSQKSGTSDGRNVMRYDIDCIFKPGL